MCGIFFALLNIDASHIKFSFNPFVFFLRNHYYSSLAKMKDNKIINDVGG